jgi:hypothetical protein
MPSVTINNIMFHIHINIPLPLFLWTGRGLCRLRALSARGLHHSESRFDKWFPLLSENNCIIIRLQLSTQRWKETEYLHLSYKTQLVTIATGSATIANVTFFATLL